MNRVVVNSQCRQVLNLFNRERAGLEEILERARQRREIDRRFGRFPNRNTIPGRTSSPDETEWLTSPGAFSS